MVYKHAVVAAFSIYAWHCEDAAKGVGVGGHGLKNHGTVFLNFCGNPEVRKLFNCYFS